MRYLKSFESYESFKQVQDDIDDIKDILQVFIDDDWESVNIDFVPKRWENPKVNHIIESDFIQIYLKKKNCKPGSKYPLDAEFNISEINEIERIFNIYKNNKIEVSICLSDNITQGYFSQDFIYGKWIDIEKSKIEGFLKDDIKRNIKILGINIKIFLDTVNIDQK
jgi:hypothetical protein